MLRKSMINYNVSIGDIESISDMNRCPKCHFSIKPIYLTHLAIKVNENIKLSITYLCPECNEFIFTEYIDEGGFDNDKYEYHYNWKLKAKYPYIFKEKEFETEISDISEKFIVIYNQAKHAEEMGLTEICGMGYRKALEFLIKDYAKRKHPDEVQNIEQTFLKPCIQNYIENEQIKLCAVGAAYLGNDESHYVRKWEDKDLSDLKKLIEMTVYWIMYSENTERFIKEMELNR